MSDIDYTEIGHRMRAIRLEEGCTQQDIADDARQICDTITLDVYGRMERGARRSDLLELEAVADVLPVPLDWLIYGHTDPKPASASAALVPGPDNQWTVEGLAEIPIERLREGMIVQFVDHMHGFVGRGTIEAANGELIYFKGNSDGTALDRYYIGSTRFYLLWAPSFAEPMGYAAEVELEDGTHRHRISGGRFPWAGPSDFGGLTVFEWEGFADKVVRIVSDGSADL